MANKAFVLSIPKSSLYRYGKDLGMSEKASRALTERGQDIRVNVVVNEVTGEFHALGINGVPLIEVVEL